MLLSTSLSFTLQPPCRHTLLRLLASKSVWRPTLNDVNRISRGDAAQHRGTGSRAVPHRLNADERKAYERSQKVGYCQDATYRRERKDAPLRNLWRQWCDAQGRPAVFWEKSMDGKDSVVVDLSTLRGEFYEQLGDGEDGLENVIDALEKIAGNSASLDETVKEVAEEDEDLVLTAPIWRLPPLTLTWDFETRSEAKDTASKLAEYCLTSLKGSKLLAAAAVAPKTTKKKRPRFIE